MKLSSLCYNKTKALWEETIRHPFVSEMADGSLPYEKFRYYMMEDFFYLKRYIDIFAAILKKAETLKEKKFISENISAVIDEIYRVHIPSMEKLQISLDELKNQNAHIDILSYTNYMKEITENHDYLSGLVAILNCSWSYAYIGKSLIDKISKDCPYREWFISYSKGEYINTNNELINMIDELSENISDERKEALSDVFYNCALYEYRLWEMFYEMGENILRKEQNELH